MQAECDRSARESLKREEVLRAFVGSCAQLLEAFIKAANRIGHAGRAHALISKVSVSFDVCGEKLTVVDATARNTPAAMALIKVLKSVAASGSARMKALFAYSLITTIKKELWSCLNTALVKSPDGRRSFCISLYSFANWFRR